MKNKKLYIIANTIAGRNAGENILQDVKELLESRGIPYQAGVTEGKGHAAVLADRALSEGFSGILCIGGDGTVFEIVNGLAGRPARLYFVPCGTGNDFVRMLGLPGDPVRALEAQLDGKPGLIDVGQAGDYYFLNVSGGGFDTEVLRQAEHFKRFGKGIIPYFMGILAALKSFRSLDAELEIQGRTFRRRLTIFAVGNGRYYGGGMKAVPRAEINDGFFDVILADKVGRLRILRLLGSFISGKHTGLPEVREIRCRELTVRCPGMTVNLDGELVKMDRVHYKLLPGALEVCLPEYEKNEKSV